MNGTFAPGEGAALVSTGKGSPITEYTQSIELGRTEGAHERAGTQGGAGAGEGYYFTHG